MPDPNSPELEKYKKSVVEKLATLTPVLQKIAVGDFLANIEIPEKEDEFIELFVALHLMIEDLRELDKNRKEAEESLIASRKELEEKLNELKQVNKLMVGRELRMGELRKEIEELKKKLG